MVRQSLIALCLAALACASPSSTGSAGIGATKTPANPDDPPPAPREFRAAWVASVANIDWPSQKGLPVAQQQAEITAMLDKAAALHLNAMLFQVRPAADALYASSIEPWSEWLSGEQGKAPVPPYDPLQMWIEEAHKRGIELHAWMNPYRAKHSESHSPLAPNHIANTHPNAVKQYGDFLWMDPGEPACAEQTLAVITDIVRRYDVDGIHIDDYFYPYPVNAPGTSTEVDFPDEQSYGAYGGGMPRADWRRKNVSDLISKIDQAIHREKAWVKFGVSPFGLGRPDRRPPGVTGFSQYDKLYADVELWLEKGWLDYLAPQLYWKIESTGQPFGPLLDYWVSQNPQNRQIWPGLYTSSINDTDKSWQPDDVLNQIKAARQRQAVHGQVHFSMVSLMQNRKGITDRLTQESYQASAIVPPTPWLDPTPPNPPALDATDGGKTVHVRITPGAGKPVTMHALWARHGNQWDFVQVQNNHLEVDIESESPIGTLNALVASSFDRVGNESMRVHIAAPFKR